MRLHARCSYNDGTWILKKADDEGSKEQWKVELRNRVSVVIEVFWGGRRARGIELGR